MYYRYFIIFRSIYPFTPGTTGIIKHEKKLKNKKETTFIGWESAFLCDLTIDLTAAAKCINILHADKLARKGENNQKVGIRGRAGGQGTDLVLKN